MKKWITTLLVLTGAILLAACGNDEATTSADAAKGSSSAVEVIAGVEPLENKIDIKIGYPTQGVSMLPLWVAQDKGIFKKYNVNTELIYVAGSPRVQETLNGGGIDVAITSIEAAGSAKAVGIDTVTFTALAHKMALKIYAREDVDINNLKEAMKGKTIIAGVEGSLYDYLARDFVKNLGLEPKVDVEFLYMGGEGDRTAVFLKGDADFYLVAPPTSFKIGDMGYQVIHDFADNDVLISGLVMKKEDYETQQELAKVLAASMIEATAYIKANKEDTLKIIKKWTGMDDAEQIEKTYAATLPTLPDKPTNPNELVQFYLDNAQSTEVQAMSPSDIVDNSIVDALEEAGFIDAIMKK